MKKSILTIELISDALDFYNKNFGEVFLEGEIRSFSEKLLMIVEYDYIIQNKKLPHNLPQNTLYLIYFIGEYKKAYQYATQDNKDKNKDTFEGLGVGFPNKEKVFKNGLEKILDESIDINERVKLLFKNMLLLPLKKPAYKKIGMLFLGTTYINFSLIKSLLNNIHNHNKYMQMSLNALELALEFYEDTYIAEDKILNSSFIMIYTVLTQNLKMEEEKSFKYSKDLVNTFIDTKKYVTDKYRQSYLTDKNIYFAGIYNGMPIFQWYISDIHPSYYLNEDIKKLKVIFRKIYTKNELDFTQSYVMLVILKLFNKKASIKDVEIIYKSINETSEINKWIYTSHKFFSALPAPLLQHLPKPKKSFILKIMSLFIGILSKFAELKSKFTKK